MTTMTEEQTVAAVLTTGPQLRKAVRWVTSLPVLACGAVRVIVAGDDLIMSSTDFETTRLLWLPLAASGDPEVAQVLVPADVLKEMAASMPQGKAPVELSVTAGVQVDLTANPGADDAHRVSVLPDRGYDTYPAQPAMPGEAATMNRAELAAAITRVGVAAGDDKVIPWLAAIRMQPSEAGVLMGATDRYKIAVETVPCTGPAGVDVLFPAREAEAFAKTADGEQAFLFADAGELAALTDGVWTVITRRVIADPVDVWKFTAAQEAKVEFTTAITVQAETLAGLMNDSPLGAARVKGELRAGKTLPEQPYVDVAAKPGEPLTLVLQRGEKPWTHSKFPGEVEGAELVAGMSPGKLGALMAVLAGPVQVWLAPGKDGRVLNPAKITCEAHPAWAGWLAMFDPSK